MRRQGFVPQRSSIWTDLSRSPLLLSTLHICGSRTRSHELSLQLFPLSCFVQQSFLACSSQLVCAICAICALHAATPQLPRSSWQLTVHADETRARSPAGAAAAWFRAGQPDLVDRRPISAGTMSLTTSSGSWPLPVGGAWSTVPTLRHALPAGSSGTVVHRHCHAPRLVRSLLRSGSTLTS